MGILVVVSCIICFVRLFVGFISDISDAVVRPDKSFVFDLVVDFIVVVCILFITVCACRYISLIGILWK